MEEKTKALIEELKKESKEKQHQLLIMRQHCQKLEVELIGIDHSIQTLEKLLQPEIKKK